MNIDAIGAVIGIVCLVEVPLMFGLFILLRLLVKDAIEEIGKKVNQAVVLADSADGQYQAIRKRVEVVEEVAAEALAATQKLEGEVKAVQRRVGLPNV